MVDFWSTLTELVKQYTVADTANVFTIVGGIATVVAAVGAIIAVVVTKGIAKEQIEIAKTQNEISVAQAEIAEQQNSIALLNQRMETLQDLDDFFREWELIDSIFKSSEIKAHSRLCKETLLNRTCIKSSKSNEDMNLMDYITLQSDQSDYDKKMFDRIPYLFELDDNLNGFRDKLKSHYSDLSRLINARMQNDESKESFSIIISRFTEFFKKHKNELIESLEAQTNLKLKKREV